MAVMWPRTLPPDIVGNVLRKTECDVYRRLEAVLDDSFVVFYSRPWLGLKPDGEEIDGECDFVIAHADLGMLALEVKGGAVSYDPHSDRWTSRDRWKVIHNIKNPVHQAKVSKHELLRKLNDSPYWKGRRIKARHGVILPHAATPVGDLGADMPQRIFCFSETFAAGLREWILERFGDSPTGEGRTQALGSDGVHALEKILAKPFQLRIPLNSLLSQDDAELQVLTQQQFHILRAIEAVPRAAISGGAGTGKTVLAMEEVRRCGESGLPVLYLCYNRGLATEVRLRLAGLPSVTVMTFHELCGELIKRAGIPIPSHGSKTQLFEETYPELLLQAFELLTEVRYGAIIVDEGQDFLPLWWAAVEAGLSADQNRFRVFYDNNQRVYASADGLPKDVDLVPIRLTLNLRNTRRIHECVRLHYLGYEVEAIGPEGVEVCWARISSEDGLVKKVSEYISRLCVHEGVTPGDLAVLVATENAIEEVAIGGRLGEYRTARCDEDAADLIIVDSIRRFKGLERPVVVIAVSSDIVLNKELPYVALSRARTHMVIIGSDKILDRIRSPLY